MMLVINNMYWQGNNTSSPHFESVLQKEGVTLQELMEEDDIIQECKVQNKKLVDFLCQRNILEELVTLITEEPSEELDERIRYKYPNIACELLTCDVPALNESLSRDNELLEKLYSFMDKEPPLNPLLASFLSRTLGVLIVKRSSDQQWISYQFTCLQAMEFLKDKENFISLLFKHLGTSAIMDLTLKLITEVGDANHRESLLDWLESQKLVQSLVALFDPSVDSERQHNASQLLCDVLRISREILTENKDRSISDPILTRIQSPETVALLMNYMLKEEKSESSIVAGIQVLLALLGHRNSFCENNAYDEADVERKQQVATSTALVIVDRLKDFHHILLDPPKRPLLKTSIGALDPPLGNTRLQVTRLLSVLIALDNEIVLREIMRLGTVEVLLDLFFTYVWNNFLHSQVQQCISGALVAHIKPNEAEHETSDNVMYPYLILKCRLLDRIIEAWKDNEQKQTQPKGVRQGYMGHLINIANLVAEQCKENSSLDTFITEHVPKDRLEAWNDFANSDLEETNKVQRITLGGIHPNNNRAEHSSDEYISCPIGQQNQSDMIENVEFFYSTDFSVDDLQNSLEHGAKLGLINNEMTEQQEKFKKACMQYVNTLDDTDEVLFDMEKIVPRPRGDMEWWNNSEEEHVGSSETPMEVEPWSKVDDSANISVVEPTNPWANLHPQNTSVSEDGWADFGSFTTDFSAPQFPGNTNAVTDTSDSTAATTSVATTQDVQSSGDQKTSEENNSTAATEEKLEQMKEFKIDEKMDNHPAEPVSIEDNSKLISSSTSSSCPISAPAETTILGSAPEEGLQVTPSEVATPTEAVSTIDASATLTEAAPSKETVTPIEAALSTEVVAAPIEAVLSTNVAATPIEPVLSTGVVATPIEAVLSTGVVATPIEAAASIEVVATPTEAVATPIDVIATPIEAAPSTETVASDGGGGGAAEESI